MGSRPMPANEAGLLLRLSPREQETIVEALKLRLDAIDKERDAVSQALAAVRLSRVG